MKKIDVINLIKYHYQSNNDEFSKLSFDIAKEFEKNNDSYAASLIEGIVNSNYSFTTQSFFSDYDRSIIEQISNKMTNRLYLPDSINDDINGIINSFNSKNKITKLLFVGKPGTGKTESVKLISQKTNKKLFIINFTNLIDSKLGETLKNIEKLFSYISTGFDLNNSIFLFDEIDLLALDRTSKNDIREMGRASSLFIRCLDRLSEDTIIIATTNLEKQMDKAIKRRFDYEVDFNRYSSEDLSEIAVLIAKELKDNLFYKNEFQIIRKLFLKAKTPYTPSEIRSLIRIALAFSKPNDDFDYIRKIFSKLYGTSDYKSLETVLLLRNFIGLTLRDIEKISGLSIASLSRMINDNKD